MSAHLTEHKVTLNWYHSRIYATQHFLFLTLQNSLEASSSLRDVLFYVFSTLTIYSHLPWQQSALASNQPVAYIHKQIHSKGIIFLLLLQPWCSTQVDETGHHIGGRGKWGNCGPGCPIPPDDRESTVVVQDTQGRSYSFYSLTLTMTEDLRRQATINIASSCITLPSKDSRPCIQLLHYDLPHSSIILPRTKLKYDWLMMFVAVNFFAGRLSIIIWHIIHLPSCSLGERKPLLWVTQTPSCQVFLQSWSQTVITWVDEKLLVSPHL